MKGYLKIVLIAAVGIAVLKMALRMVPQGDRVLAYL